MPNILTDEHQQWVHFAPPELINRQFSEWQGLRADVVTAVRQNPFEYTFSSPQHLLIAAEQSERDDGETLVEGLPRSRFAISAAGSPSCRRDTNSTAGKIRAYSRA